MDSYPAHRSNKKTEYVKDRNNIDHTTEKSAVIPI
jgi:hypothetical protein